LWFQKSEALIAASTSERRDLSEAKSKKPPELVDAIAEWLQF
jgi:hypothetical protein